MKFSKAKVRNMRKVAGTSIPRMNTTSKAFASAQNAAGKAGYAGEAGDIEVEGGDSRPRLDKPGRKRGGAC